MEDEVFNLGEKPGPDCEVYRIRKELGTAVGSTRGRLRR